MQYITHCTLGFMAPHSSFTAPYVNRLFAMYKIWSLDIQDNYSVWRRSTNKGIIESSIPILLFRLRTSLKEN